VLQRPGREGSAIPQAQLGLDALQVLLDRVLFKAHGDSDLFIGQSLSHQGNHLALTLTGRTYTVDGCRQTRRRKSGHDPEYRPAASKRSLAAPCVTARHFPAQVALVRYPHLTSTNVC